MGRSTRVNRSEAIKAAPSEQTPRRYNPNRNSVSFPPLTDLPPPPPLSTTRPSCTQSGLNSSPSSLLSPLELKQRQTQSLLSGRPSRLVPNSHMPSTPHPPHSSRASPPLPTTSSPSSGSLTTTSRTSSVIPRVHGSCARIRTLTRTPAFGICTSAK